MGKKNRQNTLAVKRREEKKGGKGVSGIKSKKITRREGESEEEEEKKITHPRGKYRLVRSFNKYRKKEERMSTQKSSADIGVVSWIMETMKNEKLFRSTSATLNTTPYPPRRADKTKTWFVDFDRVSAHEVEVLGMLDVSGLDENIMDVFVEKHSSVVEETDATLASSVLMKMGLAMENQVLYNMLLQNNASTTRSVKTGKPESLSVGWKVGELLQDEGFKLKELQAKVSLKMNCSGKTKANQQPKLFGFADAVMAKEHEEGSGKEECAILEIKTSSKPIPGAFEPRPSIGAVLQAHSYAALYSEMASKIVKFVFILHVSYADNLAVLFKVKYDPRLLMENLFVWQHRALFSTKKSKNAPERKSTTTTTTTTTTTSASPKIVTTFITPTTTSATTTATASEQDPRPHPKSEVEALETAVHRLHITQKSSS